MASTKGLKPGDRRYNADTNTWEVKEKKTKPTPASNTRKKMGKKATVTTTKPATKEKKAPIPKTRTKPGGARPEGKAAGMPAAKTGITRGGKRGGSAGITRGGNAGAKYSKEEKMSSVGIQLGVKKKPKAKLSK